MNRQRARQRGWADFGGEMEFSTGDYRSAASEIVEENSTEITEGSRSQIPTLAERNGEDVYVAVGKGQTSMDALVWTLKHKATPSTFVYLVHVFPQANHIPTPLGMLPRSQVTAAQVEIFLAQERENRRLMLHRFLNLCSASQVKVDTLLIESDMIVKAVLDLIPVLNIANLVIGTTKSNLRKGSGKAKQIKRNAPDSCKVTVICEGKEVTDQMMPSPSTHFRGDENRLCFCTCFRAIFAKNITRGRSRPSI